MSEDAVMVELVPDVELVRLLAGMTPYPELDAEGLEQAAMESDSAQQAGDYVNALVGAHTLLAGLVRDIAYELRRSPHEPLDVFRARPRLVNNAQQHSRFLVQKRFLNAREAQNVQRAAAITDTPGVDVGVNLAVWSRLARKMVCTAVDCLLTRYAAWRAGCSCPGDGAVELIVFDVLGNGPAYKQTICQRCRCPQQMKAASEMAVGGGAT